MGVVVILISHVAVWLHEHMYIYKFLKHFLAHGIYSISIWYYSSPTSPCSWKSNSSIFFFKHSLFPLNNYKRKVFSIIKESFRFPFSEPSKAMNMKPKCCQLIINTSCFGHNLRKWSSCQVPTPTPIYYMGHCHYQTNRLN